MRHGSAPANYAWQALYGHPAYNSFPRHVRSLDVGFVSGAGAFVSVANAMGVPITVFGDPRQPALF